MKRNKLKSDNFNVTISYLTIQYTNFSIGVGKKVKLGWKRLLARRSHFVKIVCGQLEDVIVIYVHSLRRLLLVLAGAIVISLVVVQLVRL